MKSYIIHAVAAALLGLSATAHAGAPAPLAGQSFPIGDGGAVCEAQGVRLGASRTSPFDRKWALICRDVNRPVGTAYSWRSGSDALARVEGDRGQALACDGGARVQDLGFEATVRRCRDGASNLAWLSYAAAGDGGRTIVVEGLAAYDSALRLALASIAGNRVVPGQVDLVTTGGSGSLAQARASLGEADLLIGQGYRTNNAGDFTEAEEYFRPDLIAAAATGSGGNPADLAASRHEVLANRGLQLSNLGRHEEAARIFDEARAMELRDPIQSRLLRNFEAIDAIGRGALAEARAILVRPVPELVDPVATAGGAVEIDRALSNGLNSGVAAGLSDAVAQDTRLTTPERAALIDAQALQLGATADRLEGKPADALAKLVDARQRLSAVRQGRVVSTARLEAQMMSEMALSQEALGRTADAEGLLRQSLALVELRYPESASVSAGRARLALFLARHGRQAQAMELYRGIVKATQADRGALVGLENQLAPYFEMLVDGTPGNPALVGDMFAAAQLIERPGAAQTLGQLARRLAAGDSEASDLFRRESAIRRELNRLDLTLAHSRAEGGDPAPLAELTARRERLAASQLELLGALAAYPAYKSLSRDYLTADEMTALLKPGEAYLELVEVGDAMYAVWLAPAGANAWKVGKSAREITRLVRTVRDSISVSVGGVNATYPFDVDAARTLFDAVMGPAAGALPAVKHLVFQPDGALMELPASLLIADPAGVAAYHDRVAKGGDEYDFRGIGWLGRDRAISTALSPASFRDARRAPSSNAAQLYLGLGQNAPVGKVTEAALVRAVPVGTDLSCTVPLAAWNRPISAAELVFASRELGQDRSALITGAAFTDTAVQARGDLDQYRIVHFATHGLVTPPRPDCPIDPALLTSFGGSGSDGLLRFGDIFDLDLDADLVILSACNTASLAGLAATQAAGVEGGGGQALDGLVRAFIGAGGRQVIASHWPAPDEFDATKRLFEAFFAAPPGTATGAALLAAETRLMDAADTSHPFYWAGMALVGDGDRPLFHSN